MKYLTFILGAGASVPYGLPTGDELVRRVATHMIASSYPDEKPLGQKLELYDPISIDSYLMKYYSQKGRENDLASYKAHIAYEIIRSLQNSWLGASNSIESSLVDKPLLRFSSRNPENWLRFIIPELLDLYEKSDNSECPIKFISFNYDLSIESYLDKIITKHTATREFKDGFFQWISKAIVHLYGQVGSYHWQEESDKNSTNIWVHSLSRSWADNQALSKQDLQNHAYQLSKRIRVIGEPTRANDVHLNLAKKWIEKSQTLVFSGYAFHPDNNGLLDLENTSRAARQVILGLYKTNKRTKNLAKKLFAVGLNSTSNTNMHRKELHSGNEPENPDPQNPYIYIHEECTTYNLLKDELNLSELYSL